MKVCEGGGCVHDHAHSPSLPPPQKKKGGGERKKKERKKKKKKKSEPVWPSDKALGW